MRKAGGLHRAVSSRASQRQRGSPGSGRAGEGAGSTTGEQGMTRAWIAVPAQMALPRERSRGGGACASQLVLRWSALVTLT